MKQPFYMHQFAFLVLFIVFLGLFNFNIQPVQAIGDCARNTSSITVTTPSGNPPTSFPTNVTIAWTSDCPEGPYIYGLYGQYDSLVAQNGSVTKTATGPEDYVFWAYLNSCSPTGANGLPYCTQYDRAWERYASLSPLPTYTVTGIVSGSGSVSPMSQQVSSGGTATLTATPSANFKISSISGCGTTAYTNPSNSITAYNYVTVPITSSCSVTASFIATAPTNQPPVSNAGADKTITLPTSSVAVTGSGSDSDGSISGVEWKYISGPVGGVSFANAYTYNTTITGMTVAGTYTFGLQVTDNQGADNLPLVANNIPTASTDKVMTVTVNPPGPSGWITPQTTVCQILAYSNTCTIGHTWQTNNPTSTSLVTRNPASSTPSYTPISQNISLSSISLPLIYGSNTFYLYHNGLLLAQTPTLTAVCGSGTWDGTQCDLGVPPTTGVDLIASNGSMSTSYIFPNDTPTQFPATIKNNGDVATGGTAFWNVLVVATAPDGGGSKSSAARTQVTSNLTPGASANITFDYNPNTVSTPYSWQVCADLYWWDSTSSGNHISESNESNNCSPWTNMDPTPPPTRYIYASAGPGGTISPSGTVEISGSWEGLGSKNFTITPTTASGYSIQTPVGGSCTGTMTNSTTYTVDPIVSGCNVAVTFKLMTGTLTPGPTTSCTIPAGGNSCTVSLTRTITNPIGATTSVTSPTGTPSPSNGSSGAVTFTAPYNASGVNFYLYNNGLLLAQTNVETNCASGTSWNGSTCAANAAPTVTSPTVSSITTTGATLGANVTSIGSPSPLTARGTCWGTTTSPTTNCVAEGGTTTGVFTHARGSMPPGTLIYYRGYATNSTGTGYSTTSSFTTASLPMSGTLTPTSSTCTIASGASSCTQTISWTTTNPQGTSAVTNNGTATPSSSSGNNGTNVTFTIPYKTSSSGVTTFYLYNNSQELASAPITTVCTSGTSWNGSTCAVSSYTVTASAGSGGTISPASRSVAGGATTTFTVTPNSGYSASMGGTCGGAPASGSSAFTFTTSPISANCTVTATFTQMTGTLTPASNSCVIASGASSCTSPALTWTTTNPQGTSAVTNNGTATPSSPSGNNSSSTFIVPYNNALSGVTTFYLYNSSLLLAQATVTTTCTSGTSWNGSTCAVSAAPAISASPSSVSPGGSVTGTFSNVSSPTSSDWIGLFTVSGSSGSEISYAYTPACGQSTGGTPRASGSCVFTMPSTPGDYNLRLFASDSYSLLATSGTITVANPSSPSGTISVTSCSIAIGASTCSPALVTWSTANLPGGSTTEVTRNNPDFTAVSSLTSGTNFSDPNVVRQGPTGYFLYNNGVLLDSFAIDAPCVSGAYWDSGAGTCVATPPSNPVVTQFSVDTPTITPPATATLTWSSSNATSCTGTGFSTGGATSGSVQVGVGSYSISCDNGSVAATSGPVVVSSSSSSGPKQPKIIEN